MSAHEGRPGIYQRARLMAYYGTAPGFGQKVQPQSMLNKCQEVGVKRIGGQNNLGLRGFEYTKLSRLSSSVGILEIFKQFCLFQLTRHDRVHQAFYSIWFI